MALVNCAECSKEISDTALTCPHCGTPNTPWRITKRSKSHSSWFWWPFGIIAAIIALALLNPHHNDDSSAKQECLAALKSDMGTDTSGYQDKQAYNARVRDACKGFTIGGNPPP